MVKLLGYDSYDELSKAIGGLVLNTIHPDDRTLAGAAKTFA